MTVAETQLRKLALNDPTIAAALAEYDEKRLRWSRVVERLAVTLAREKAALRLPVKDLDV